MDISATLEELTKTCSSCPLPEAVQSFWAEGRWIEALRLLSQPGQCESDACKSCHGAELSSVVRQAIRDEELARLRTLWRDAFEKNSLEINFVCSNPAKLAAIKEVMLSADVLPPTFTLGAQPGGYNVVRLTMEL